MNPRGVYASGQWEIDLGVRQLWSGGVPVPIGSRAFDIVGVLVQSSGELVTKDELMGRVWSGAIVEEHTLQVHVSAIRRALGPDRGMLKTASGRGYRLLGNWAIRSASTLVDPVAVEPLRTPAQPYTTNFPVGTSAFIGRATAVQHLQDLLSAYRVVTLTGPGGIGKTTLALQVARNMFPGFQGHEWLVELASLSDPALVPSAVARVLGLKLGGDEISAEALARAVGSMRHLLVLDNCEHLIDAVASLVETLVRMCPRTTVLATSREILRIEGEHVYRVPPLDVPPPHQAEPDDVLGHSAVQLFITRAKALDSNFATHGESLPAIAGICRRLDGIPLAIEFASARAAALGLRQVAARLDNRFALLTSGRRTALPRHQTLRATFDWSYDLLPESERRLLRRLAVFPAGFTLEAAAAVMSDAGGAVSRIAYDISNLLAKSLLAFDGSAASARWRLLETIRAYALDKLAESGEAEQAGRRHAAFFRDLIAPAASGSSLQPATEDMARYGREIDNVRAALDWSFSSAGDPAIGIVLTAAYAPVWLNFELMVECRERTERALAGLEPDASGPILMQLHLALGFALVFTMGSVERIKTVSARALEIAESLDDVDAQMRALWALWIIHFTNSECRSAQVAAEQFSNVARRLGDQTLILFGDRLIGNTLQHGGDQREARRRLERALEVHAASKPQRHTILLQYDWRVLSRAMLARVLWLQGFVDQAINQARVSLEEAQATHQGLQGCWTIHYAAYPVALMTGDLVTAERVVTMLRDLAASLNAAFWKIVERFLQGKLLISRGEFKAGSDLLRDALDTCDRAGWTIFVPEFLGVLAQGLAGLGQLAEALAAVNQALAWAGRGGERWYVPELLRIKGELLCQDATDGSISASEDCLHEALEVARRQGALFWELRSALSLARLRVRQNRPGDAQATLASVYDRFTEGFETADLRAAKALLDSLR